MAQTIKGKIEGLDQLMARLKWIPQKMRKKVLRKAVGKAASIISKEIKRSTPVRDRKRVSANITPVKLLRKSIAQKLKAYPQFLIAVIGPRKGFRRQIGVRVRGKSAGQAIYEDPANIAHLVELGHGGPHRAPAHSFAEAGFNRAKGRARDVMAAVITQGLWDAALGAIGAS